MHDEIIERTGGSRGVLVPGAIRSAVERARWGPFGAGSDLAGRAALLLRGIAVDHPFADGNKRTAFEITDLFLRRNECHLLTGEDETLDFVLATARGKLELEEIAHWIRLRLRKP